MGGRTTTLGIVTGLCASAALIVGCAAPAASTSPAAAELAATAGQSEPTPADGLFTAAQASRGERRFTQLCADCHRTVEITRSWFSGYTHQSASDLFTIMSMTMPESSPGSLDDDDYADILAYLLRLNDYPAGDAELPANRSVLGAIAIPAR
jgi:mono/diheme cytochrome c family protein